MMAESSGAEDGEKLFAGRCKQGKMENNEDCAGKKGVSPINVDQIKSAFTGMTKEELMRYANDPFWVRVRWFLFILFWIIWALMLFTAIFIIVSTPKCAEVPSRSWWQQSPLYEIDVGSLKHSQGGNKNVTIADFLKSKVDDLSNLNIKTVLLKSVLISDENVDDVLDFRKTNIALKDIADYAKSKDIHVLLGFTPNHCSIHNEIFARSVLKEESFENFFVWVPPHNDNDHSKPPNNWISVYNGTAWEWNEHRKQFYLHQFGKNQPDFNFRNASVVQYFSDVLSFWMDNGISGFYLDKTEYLVEDSKLRDEALSMKPGFIHDQYEFYTHMRTKDLPETADVIETWSKEIRNRSGILSVSGGVGDKEHLVDYVIRPLILTPNFTASQFNNLIINWLNHMKWPSWKWACSEQYEQCFNEAGIDGLMMVSFLLPGIPVTYLGQELGYLPEYVASYYAKDNASENSTEPLISLMDDTPRRDNPEDHHSLYKSLNELRSNEAVMYGDYETKVLNDTVFCLTRTKSGSPGYAVVWNIGKSNITHVALNGMKSIPQQLTVIMKSRASFETAYNLKSKVDSMLINILAETAYVFEFVPS